MMVVFDQWVLKCLLPIQTLLLAYHQAPPNEILRVLANFTVIGESQRYAVNRVQVFAETPGRPRSVSEYHFVKH